ncbi:class I SAM-dependent methyltransferase [Iamia sp.]|uniref:class I SAM-dependent methyltransferase n=1 Tax=Iamia sp. TaxID=2722710 RepID=UPI002C258628|nr:methyltransferase domain-containing protein [Iamia sp.]HXH57999.1 methyltransferase domain-containing protein [Iamia sp.]
MAADPQAAAGAEVLHRLDVAAGATVVDAGCGSGRVTELLLERHPDVTVVALDASPSMLAAAGDRLARFGGRVVLRQADLGKAWPLDGPADAVVSTSTFHWVLDHDRLFGHVFAALRPGGALVAQCGGHGSLRAVLATAASRGVAVEGRNTYATAADTIDRLAAAGFVDVWVWLQPEPVAFPTREALAAYLADSALAPYDGGVAAAAGVAAALPAPVADFVRLNVLARRAAP